MSVALPLQLRWYKQARPRLGNRILPGRHGEALIIQTLSSEKTLPFSLAFGEEGRVACA